MSCRRHEDDTPFPPNDELLPEPGVTPRDAGEGDGSPRLAWVYVVVIGFAIATLVAEVLLR